MVEQMHALALGVCCPVAGKLILCGRLCSLIVQWMLNIQCSDCDGVSNVRTQCIAVWYMSASACFRWPKQCVMQHALQEHDKDCRPCSTVSETQYCQILPEHLHAFFFFTDLCNPKLPFFIFGCFSWRERLACFRCTQFVSVPNLLLRFVCPRVSYHDHHTHPR